MKLEHIVVKPLYVNCFFLSDDDGNLIIFDPGGEPAKIIEKIETENLKPKMILNTHGHFDHIGAVSALKEKYGIPFYMNTNDNFLLSQLPKHLAMMNSESFVCPLPDKSLEDGDTFSFGDGNINVLHTPGHTPGCVCFNIAPIKALITGDTLFCEGVGRTDFPYGDHSKLMESIKDKLLVLDDDTSVFPGHDEFSTIGWERRNNQYLKRF